jgi:beta-galactosidase
MVRFLTPKRACQIVQQKSYFLHTAAKGLVYLRYCMNKISLSICCLAIVFLTSSRMVYTQVYEVDLGKSPEAPGKGIMNFGSNTNKSGHTLSANSHYFIKNGQPWFPVMGEIHFSRCPREKWEASILKMKAAGIDIIASYIFWIHHEEEKGVFDWTGNNDLRYFVELCKKHKVYFFPRIGPWCHGEARNGGFPNWMVTWKDLRSNDSNYLKAVEILYDQIGRQLRGLYLKDDGPVIGTQLENEYSFSSDKGYQHLLTLKRLAIKAGIDVPYYTATGWPASNQKQPELIPVWGAYPEAPWDRRTTELEPVNTYLFGPITSDPRIGNDMIADKDRTTNDFKMYPYPFATAEMGGGNQITYHRRPLITGNDVTALAYTKIGCGGNLLGYYMFHGGSHPIGKLSTTQESKASGYANDYPIISYDFFSPIGEWGQLRPSYHYFRRLHTFLNDFGDQLAPTHPYFPVLMPKSPTDSTLLRFAVRSKDQKGFVVISNYQRKVTMKDFPNVQFALRMSGDAHLQFPQTPITIKNGLQAIFPFNMQMGEVRLQYATAHLFCKLQNDITTYVFAAVDGIDPEFSFNMAGIKSIDTRPLKQYEQNGHRILTFDRKIHVSYIAIETVQQQRINIMIVSPEYEAKLWKGSIGHTQHVFITPHHLVFSANRLDIQSAGNAPLRFDVYPAIRNKITMRSTSSSLPGFESYVFHVQPPAVIDVITKPVTDITPYINNKNPYPADNRNEKLSTPAYPGMKYQTNLQSVTGSQYWEIIVPPYRHKQLDEVFLNFDYTGDTGVLYKDGKLVADDFYCGEPMWAGLSRIGNANDTTRFIFQTLPLLPTADIFLEPGIRERLGGKQQSLAAVRAIVQYKASLTWK